MMQHPQMKLHALETRSGTVHFTGRPIAERSGRLKFKGDEVALVATLYLALGKKLLVHVVAETADG